MVIVYVGAVAVLFLFVVMMLDVDFAALRAGFARYWPVGLLLAGALLIEIVLTLRHKPGVRRQVIADQVARGPKTGMRIVSIKPGEGIDP